MIAHMQFTGMALGVDQLFALVVLELKNKGHNITLEAAIPCQNHCGRWPASSQKLWQDIVDACDKVTLVTDAPYQPWMMQKRNEYMVDNANLILAIWDGSNGGTANCVHYAQDKGKAIYQINPKKI